MSAAGFAAFSADLGHVGSIARDGFAAFSADLGHVFAVLAHALAAFSPDFGHVPAVLADDLAALFAGLSGFVGGELVGGAFFVCGFSAFARDGALLVALHRGEASLRRG